MWYPAALLLATATLPSHQPSQAALGASAPNLGQWPPSCIAYAILMVGNMLVNTQDFVPPDLAAAVLGWRSAAVAALQPRLQQLVPASCVQLLLGCSRILVGVHHNLQDQAKAAAAQATDSSPGSGVDDGGDDDHFAHDGFADDDDSSSSSSPGTETDPAVHAVLVAVLAGLSQPQVLAALAPGNLVDLMMGVSRLDAAPKELGQAVLTCLEPHLG